LSAGASGRAAAQAVSDYSPEGKHALVGLIAGGRPPRWQEMETAANNYDLGALSCSRWTSATTICCWR
jgi:N-acetylmuramic acid 6-phosphate etherase